MLAMLTAAVVFLLAAIVGHDGDVHRRDGRGGALALTLIPFAISPWASGSAGASSSSMACAF